MMMMMILLLTRHSFFYYCPSNNPLLFFFSLFHYSVLSFSLIHHLSPFLLSCLYSLLHHLPFLPSSILIITLFPFIPHGNTSPSNCLNLPNDLPSSLPIQHTLPYLTNPYSSSIHLIHNTSSYIVISLITIHCSHIHRIYFTFPSLSPHSLSPHSLSPRLRQGLQQSPLKGLLLSFRCADDKSLTSH